MTSTVQPVPNSVHAQSASPAGQSAATGTTSSNRSSYATAAAPKGKPVSQPTIVSSSTSSSAAVGLEASKHAAANSISPVNGRPAQPAAPSLGNSGPAIVSSSSIANGAPSGSGDHSRKASNVATSGGYTPNGTSTGPNTRPGIQFGSIGASPSPNLANSVPNMPHASLGTNLNNPGPARSPSPIPQPSVASGGGLPPRLASGPGNVSFGTFDGADHSSRPPSMPSGPANSQFQQPQHLRRESSQSAHSDMSSNLNRNFVPNNRGGAPNGNRGYNPSYPAAASPSFRPGMLNQRTPSNVPPYQGQAPMRMPASPYQANVSPANRPAHLHQGQMPQQNGPHMSHPYAYPPPHMNQQQVMPPLSSHPAPRDSKFPSPEEQNAAPLQAPFVHSRLQVPQHTVPKQRLSINLIPSKNPGMYVPQQFDPNYAAYYQQQMYPSMAPQHLSQYPGAPPSPRPFPGQYYPNQHGQPPQSLGMSRSSSQGIERPNSTLGQPSTPGPHPPHAPAATSASPAPSTSSYRPQPRKSAAIVIKTADGQVVDFKKSASVASPPPAKPQGGPVVVSSGAGVPSTSTPPPRSSVASPQHARTESQQAKTAEERKREFQEAIQKSAKVDEAEERKVADAAKEKEDAERKAKEAEDAKAAEEKEAAEKASNAAEEAAAKKKADEDELERWMAEIEAKEKEELAAQAAYEEKKAAAKAAKAKQDAEMADEEMRRQEREAEAREEAKLKGKQDGEGDAEAKALFASLKANPFGPSATESASGASTPASDSAMSAPAPTVRAAQPSKPAPVGKQKPAALKLETNKSIEPAQPTAGMQSLKSARFLQIRSESVKYPEGIMSPNPAINPRAKKTGQVYDKSFLLQFQEVFKEKPSTDWDKVVKDTVGDSSDSARPGSARTPSIANGRQPSRGPGGMPGSGLPVMGSFQGRPAAPGSTSEQRFQASLQQPARPAPPTGFGSFAGGRGSGFPMGAPGMIRSTSSQSIAQGGMNQSRNASQRGTGGRGSRRGGPNHQQEAQMAKTMPLTAGVDLKPLVVSKSGWTPASITNPQQVQVMPGTHMAPDMVQRKVKAALNKMTPEKFDKIADQILVIASQSKDENDGRTLRQVIQLTFEKACDEAHWASMYAKFCKRMLEEMGPEIKDENVRDKQDKVVVGGALFRKYLLNRCQEEFERGWEVDLPDKPEGQAEEVMLSDEYYIAAAAKRRGLGLIQFIGELYKLNMLTLRIMHECVVKLLQFEGLPDEAAVESLTKLLRTIGATMDADPKGKPMIDTYFDRISHVRSMQGLNSRLYYMLEDIIDLRKKNWKSKDDAKGPKTIQEIHNDAVQAQQAAEMERQRGSQRGGGGGRLPAGRGDARSFSHNMPPPDYPRNQVGMDDLKKLTRNARTIGNSGPSALGPTSLLGSRSSSGRRGLTMARGGEDSGASSRTGTPPVKDKDSSVHQNAFSALASLDGSGDHTDDVTSLPSTSPQVNKAQPAKGDDVKEANGDAKEA
ncbi:hypothetical protein EJ08DRAFT_700484 [Tothia fuscella]|uniref:MIF4G domain-containing protein n=1 Tax=Tothia fuscella TaxID=1048955 RepID=A0A9P4NKE6_9PEZI|nr:hypothetical protein EJ08DRAFT_700484 [Tothia fuscella]